MINLLPPELKSGYHYARRNVRLRKWVVACFIGLVGLALIGTYGFVTIQQSSKRYQQQIAATEATFQKEQFAATQKRVQDISGSFKLVVQVLGQEVLFSKLIQQIAATIPTRANLTGLTISKTDGAIDISAIATDYNTATQVQVNLADPKNKIFSKADIVNIGCGNDDTTQFPCEVTIRALFADNNPFLFINSKGARR